MIKKTLALPSLLALLFAGSLAVAQAPQAPQTPQAAPSAADLDSQTKENFVSAYSEIMEIQMRYADQMRNATEEEEAAALQEAAQGEMQEAVTANDLTVQEYNLVIELAATDPELLAELETAIENLE